MAPGDVVVYYLRGHTGPTFLHVAEVLEIPVGDPIVPKVLSKLDDWGGEISHSYLDVPSWGTPKVDFFWTFLREP